MIDSSTTRLYSMTTTYATSQALTIYAIASVNGVELKKAMLDSESSIDIITLVVLDAAGIPREKIKQPIEVSRFRSYKTFTIRFVNLDLTIGQIKASHKFHVVDSQTSYHLLLEGHGSTATKPFHRHNIST